MTFHNDISDPIYDALLDLEESHGCFRIYEESEDNAEEDLSVFSDRKIVLSVFSDKIVYAAPGSSPEEIEIDFSNKILELSGNILVILFSDLGSKDSPVNIKLSGKVALLGNGHDVFIKNDDFEIPELSEIQNSTLHVFNPLGGESFFEFGSGD